MSSFKAGKTGDMPAAGKKSTISGGGGAMPSREPAGVESGLSEHSAMNVGAGEPKQDFARNPLTGNALENIKPRGKTKASAKGKSFTIDA